MNLPSISEMEIAIACLERLCETAKRTADELGRVIVAKDVLTSEPPKTRRPHGRIRPTDKVRH